MTSPPTTTPRYALIDGEIPLASQSTHGYGESKAWLTSADLGFPYGFVHDPRDELIVKRLWLLSSWDNQLVNDAAIFDDVFPKHFKWATKLHRDYQWLLVLAIIGLLGTFISPIFFLAFIVAVVLICGHYWEIAVLGSMGGFVLRLKVLGITLNQQALYVAPPIYFEGDEDSILWNPPSVISLLHPPEFSKRRAAPIPRQLSIHRDDEHYAQGILRGTLIGLWSSGVIAFDVAVLQSYTPFGPPQPATCTLVVNLGNLDEAVTLGYLEKRIIRTIQGWQTMYTSPIHRTILRSASTLSELIAYMTPSMSRSFAAQIIRDASKTAAHLKLATPRKNGLDFRSTVTTFMQQDAETLQSVANTTATYYDIVASEIERVVSNIGDTA